MSDQILTILAELYQGRERARSAGAADAGTAASSTSAPPTRVFSRAKRAQIEREQAKVAATIGVARASD